MCIVISIPVRYALGSGNQTEYTRDVTGSDEEKDGQQGEGGGERPLSEGLREAVEGAFAATGLTRDRAQEISDRTRETAQDIVGEFSRMGQDAREALEGLRLVGRDEFDALVERVDELERRLGEATGGTAGPADGD
jgi:polyhydroxyalkanoate synthesis regulator phasin